jgi:hypothetical protein
MANEIENIHMLAVSRLFADKEFLKELRSKILPGTYDVNFALHIKGNVRVGNDFERTPTTNIPIKSAFALFVAYAGLVVGEAAMTALISVVSEAIEDEEKAAKLISEKLPMVDNIMAIIDRKLSGLPKVKTKGVVTCNLGYEFLTEQKEEE